MKKCTLRETTKVQTWFVSGQEKLTSGKPASQLHSTLSNGFRQGCWPIKTSSMQPPSQWNLLNHENCKQHAYITVSHLGLTASKKPMNSPCQLTLTNKPFNITICFTTRQKCDKNEKQSSNADNESFYL